MDQRQAIKAIVAKCQKSPAYFANTFCKVFDAERKSWVPFTLWPRQVETLGELHEHKRLVVLKARQLGLTWLVLSYALWLMLFKRRSQIGLWSLREKESSELLQTRLLGMYDQLP